MEAVRPDVLQKLPTGHVVQFNALVNEALLVLNEPGPHAAKMHVAFPPADTIPVGHGKQEDKPVALLNEFGGHCKQAAMPVVLEN